MNESTPASHPITSEDLVAEARARIREVDPAAFHPKRGKVIVIDVRDQESFNKGHITNAIHIPFDELEAKKEMLAKKYKQRPIVVSCDRGNLSGRARIKLIGLLEKNEVYNLNGGIVKWKEDGLPLKMG